MIYETAKDWQNDTHKRVLLFGMSGLGKTHVSNILRASGNWFHYSVDYRIGTRYMGEAIVDNLKREAMKNPFLKDLLKSGSIRVGSNISFDDLSPLATYLGKPGDAAMGGLPFAEYQRRQKQHHHAEVSALLDTVHFIDRASDLYSYGNFVCDSGGSICEVVDPNDPNDPVLTALSKSLLLVGIESSTEHNKTLAARFEADPKPMCYQTEFLDQTWTDFLRENNVVAEEVDPDAYMRWTFAKALYRRQPRYEAMARNWGISVTAADISGATSDKKFEDMISNALEKRQNQTS